MPNYSPSTKIVACSALRNLNLPRQNNQSEIVSSIARINFTATDNQSNERVHATHSCCLGQPGLYRGIISLGITIAQRVPSPRPPGVIRTEILNTFSLGRWIFQSGMVFKRGSCLQFVKSAGSSGAPLCERCSVSTCPITAERSHSGKRIQTE